MSIFVSALTGIRSRPKRWNTPKLSKIKPIHTAVEDWKEWFEGVAGVKIDWDSSKRAIDEQCKGK